MSTSTRLALHVMPSDTARVSAAQASSKRLAAAGSMLWRFFSAIGAARGRRAVIELARSTAASRPELSDALRRAANGDRS